MTGGVWRRVIARMPDDVLSADKATQDRWIFQAAAYWPDVARGGPYDRPWWHFINLPLFVDPADEVLRPKLKFNQSFEYPPPRWESNCAYARKKPACYLGRPVGPTRSFVLAEATKSLDDVWDIVEALVSENAKAPAGNNLHLFRRCFLKWRGQDSNYTRIRWRIQLARAKVAQNPAHSARRMARVTPT